MMSNRPPRILVGDFETNGLMPTKVHCAVFKSYPDGKWFIFKQEEVYGQQFRDLLEHYDFIAGHNFIGYDFTRVMSRLLPRFKDFNFRKILDTLILSRMFDFDRRGGHGLESIGEQMGVSKPDIEQWETFDEAMLHRCKQDVEINWRWFNKLYHEMGWEQMTGLASRIEHAAQLNMERMGNYGFWFNLPYADQLYAKATLDERTLKAQLQKDFPPVARPRNRLRPVTPVTDKTITEFILDEDGNKIRGEGKGKAFLKRTRDIKYFRDRIPLEEGTVFGDFCAFEWEEFNPGSPDQLVSKLNSCGWQPVNFNKPGKAALAAGIRVGTPKASDEDNLDTIPDDAPQSIKNIKHYLVVRNRVSRMEEWYGSLKDDQRIHGSIIGLGARTHRSAHRGPNMANVPAILNRKALPAYMGKEFRSCWGVPPVNIIKTGRYDHIYKTRDERRIVGVDAEGIQLRILAHHLDDPKYTEQVVDGDIHTYNMFAAGINPGEPSIDKDKLVHSIKRMPTVEELQSLRLDKKSGVEWAGRNIAKTFIYAYLLGAGNAKIKQITGIDGQTLKDRFYEEIPALRELQEVKIPKDIARGYSIGIDGRKFSLDNVPPHKVLSIWLQGGEATIMKLALNLLIKWIDEEDLDAFPVAFVHDEFQIDSALHCAERVKELGIKSIIDAGRYLNLRCPLDSKGKVGLTWADSH